MRLLQVAYKAVMQSVTTADRAGYESLLKTYRETDVSQERTRVLSKNSPLGFSCTYQARLHFFRGCTGLDVLSIVGC